MLHLPAELVISILQYVPLSTLGNLLSTSRAWNNFFEVNQSTLYHNAAVLHGFIPSASVLYSSLGTALSRRSLTGVSDWKSFCRAQIRLQKAWRGEASSCVTAHRSAGSSVHRIKVDEQRGFIIVTTSSGGLSAVDLYEDEVLWSLPVSYVHAFAHCEYGAGYLIFDREGGQKEVWRVLDDTEAPDSPTFASPDETQHDISSSAAELHGFPLTSRGHFKPWMVLNPPAPTRAFRFVFPTLLAATTLSLFIWDITTGELIQIIRDTQLSPDGVGSGTHLGRINYVEISARTDGHAFICGSNTLRVFSRTSGRCVLDIPSTQVSYAKNTYTFVVDGSHEENWLPHSVLKPQPTNHQIVLPTANGRRRLMDEFIAVHVSACGSHFAALLASSRLIIVPFFERIVSGAAEIYDIALDIQLGSPVSVARYLAFENGHIGIATGTGLFVVTVDFESTRDLTQPPPVAVHRAAWFNHPLALSCVSCLQMTPTGFFLNWDPMPEENEIRDYQPDNLIPDPGWERLFAETLLEVPRIMHLPNGDDVLQLFEPANAGAATSSSVFSIDFVPTGSS
ncbi:hypothetical protein C8R43DRAFT_164647 [Mycena crocata]|nr:hypothetical protein C8R43DRAFT_164647 [Mycena crocata]